MLVGEKAPFFNTTAVFGKEFKQVSLTEYKGKYLILFFYPLDFTFVCPTELHAFQERLSDFNELGAEVLACSVDSHFSHHAWLQLPKAKGGIEGVSYGILSDLGGSIAKDYDVLGKDGVAYRGLFLIDKDGVIKHQVVNDLPLGRSVDEVIRTLKALIHTEKYGEVCPANWDSDKKSIKATHESVSNYLKDTIAS